MGPVDTCVKYSTSSKMIKPRGDSGKAEIARIRLPKWIIWLTIAVSVLPFMLVLLGVDFSSRHYQLSPDIAGLMTDHELQDAMLHSLKGAFIHFLLEWSAVAIAFATAILAFIQYRITNNPVTPIIGVVLLCAGFMDAFHALAATHIIRSIADNDNFIPFTWALSRIFNGLILITGAGIFLMGFKIRMTLYNRNQFVLATSAIFLLVSFGIVQYCALSSNLPATMYSDKLITRPFDVVPLLLFMVLGLWIFPKFYKRQGNVFTHALIWSMVPAVATQLHMSFGSSQLFDAHFNIGHFLKIIFYMVPFTGMAIDYVSTYREEKRRLAELAVAHKELEQKNKELGQFAYIASHDLQEPLRTISGFVELLKESSEGNNNKEINQYLDFISQGASRMSALIKGLLDYSRIGRNKELSMVDCNEIVKAVREDLASSIAESNAKFDIGQLPTVKGYEIELRLLFQNLIVNAIKFRKKDTLPKMEIFAEIENEDWKFCIRDNGIGIAREYNERIFSLFQRLHNNSEYEGTGIGLSHCQKIVDLHGGKIWVDSSPDEGSSFYFTLPA